MKLVEKITICMRKTMRKELEKLARADNRTTSDYVRVVLEGHLAAQASGPEVGGDSK